jgi:hypothetical protein
MTYPIALDSEARLCHLGLLYLALWRYSREITLRNLVQEAMRIERCN